MDVNMRSSMYTEKLLTFRARREDSILECVEDVLRRFGGMKWEMGFVTKTKYKRGWRRKTERRG